MEVSVAMGRLLSTLLGIAAMSLTGACDRLTEHPWIASPSVSIVSPQANATLVQPGPTLSIEVTVTGCAQVQSLALRVQETELADARPQPLDQPGRYSFQVTVVDLLGQFLYGPVAQWLVSLQAHLVCADYGQEAQSNWLPVNLSPFANLVDRAFSGPVYHLQAGVAAGQVLAISEDQLALFIPGVDDLIRNGVPSKNGLARVVGTALYLWTDCLDPVCWNRRGTVYRLDANDLGLSVGLRLDLLDEAVDILAAPDPGRLLIVVSGQAFEPKLHFSDTDFQNTQELVLETQPVAPARRLANGDVLFLGLADPPVAASSQIVVVGPGPTVTTRPVSLPIEWSDAAWAVSGDGLSAVVLNVRSGDLYRVTTGDGVVMPVVNVAATSEYRIPSVEFVDSGRVLLAANDSIRMLDFESAQEEWRVSPDGGVEAAAALPDGGCALLTGDLDLWVVSGTGEVVDRKGALPGSWRLTSNLFVTDTGWVHFALGTAVAGYQLHR